MQQTIGFKQFMVNHVVATALACGVLVSGALGAAGLSATGNLPWAGSGDAQPVAASQAARAAWIEQAQRFYTLKEARLEASESHAAAVAARAAQQETLRRYVEHKEAQLDSLPVAHAARVDAAQIYFLELNELPVTAVAPPSSERIRFDEDNRWLPGSDDGFLPMPNPTEPVGETIKY